MRQISTVWARGAFAAAVGASMLFSVKSLAAPVSTAFTYQGELYDDGVPFVGSVDLRFTPYADASNPTVLGAPVVIEDVLVSNGVFTARVDFGPGFFVGDAVFMEVAVRPFDSTEAAAFEALTPRQEITAAPYALKPAPGSVTDLELANDAVGSTQIADNTVASGDVTDASLVPQDLALSGGAFDSTFWRVGGNTGASGVLGVLDPGQSLALFAPGGLTVNGSRFNGNSELTLRGNPNTVETNVDLTLWPRGGEAFFNLGVLGQTPADARFQVHAVGTNPFTGFDTILQLNFDGSLGVGGANPAPHARLHVSRVDLGFDAPADSSEALELVLEDSDAQLGLYSGNGGSGGSVIGLAEMSGGALVNQWGIGRATSGAGSALQLRFGVDDAAAANPVLASFGTNGSLALGGPAINADTELYVAGSPSIPGGPADLGLVPQGGTALWNLSAAGTNETNTTLLLQFVGTGFNYEPRMRFGANGAVGIGRFALIDQADSFVFADDSPSTSFGASGTGQFLVRAGGGVALNGSPYSSTTELTVRPDSTASGASADLVMLPGSVTRGYRLGVRGTAGVFTLTTVDPGGSDDELLRLLLDGDGKLAVNPATGPGAFQTNAFPLKVGTSGDTTNGNGAFLSAGGTWTNTSSRLFKEAFSTLDVQDILSRALALPVLRWRYRGGAGGWHVGPVAEDFHAAFGLGESERYIGTVDADGVALAAIQGLAQREDARVAELQQENESLRAALAALARRVEALERAE